MLFKHLNDALSWRLVAKHAWPCVECRSASGSGQSSTTAKETQKLVRNFVFFVSIRRFGAVLDVIIYLFGPHIIN